jgi:hypothetical protein
MCQHDFQGRLLFQHRNSAKWNLAGPNPRIPGFRFENECLACLANLRAQWDRVVHSETPEPPRPDFTKRPRHGEPGQPQIEVGSAPRKRLATRLPLG